MNKITLILLLVTLSNSAMGAWVMLGTSNNQNMSVYADSFIDKNGASVKLWSMIDFKKAIKLGDGKQFQSWQTQYEFDCKIKQSRIIAAAMYSGSMGEGEKTNTLDFRSPDWVAVPANSNGEVLWNYACGREDSKHNAK